VLGQIARFRSRRGATESQQSGRAQTNRNNWAYTGDEQARNCAAQGQSSAGPYRSPNDRSHGFAHTIVFGIGRGQAFDFGAARFSAQKGNGLRTQASGHESTNCLLSRYTGTENSDYAFHASSSFDEVQALRFAKF
jgi:hypothetical protein